MRLNIYQYERNYRFYKNDEEHPFLTGKVFHASSRNVIATIYDSEDMPVAYVELGRASRLWRKSTYLFHSMHGIIEVTIMSSWKGHWAFEYKGYEYNFYFHNGYKKSLFKSGEQVAKFDARESYPLNPKKAFIVANNEEDDLLLLSLFLLYDKESALDPELPRNSAFLGRGMRESDPYWFPRK